MELNTTHDEVNCGDISVKNKETGETKEVKMSIHDWDQWCEDNPDWERYYTPDNAPKLGLEMGEPFSKSTPNIQVGKM